MAVEKTNINKWKNFIGKINALIGVSRGFAAILLMVFIPIIVLGVSYLTKYTSKSEVDTSNFEIPYAIGVNLAKSFNPGKTWDDQKTYLYSIAAQTYNDEALDTSKKMTFTPSSAVKVTASEESPSIENLYDFYKNYCREGREELDDDMFIRQPISDFIYDEAKKSGTYIKYSIGSDKGDGTIAYKASKYKEDKDKLQLSLSDEGQILVSCKELKRQAVVDVPRNNVDIIIAIPTNHASNTTTNSNTASFEDYSDASNADSTPIKQIARACQSFLKHFLHTAGVAVGIVPYSGKVTMSPYSNYADYTVQIPMNIPPSSTLPYAIQAMFYASDGKSGGDVIAHGSGAVAEAYGDYKNWGNSSIGLPIMARRGQEQSDRDMSFYSGALTEKTGKDSLLLDMTTSPTTGDNYKFMRMNTNPCYLGFCNTLAMTCEKDCPTYMANPYFMTGLTSDIQELIYDLEWFVPFKDERNKSNFLFLPIVMAGNMFSWGDHPSELPETGRVVEPDRSEKGRVVVIIANAPDNFEPQEMTYLGFNNDYSEIPMIESDMILFNEDRGYAKKGNNYTGVKGAVLFSPNGGKLIDTGYLFTGDSTARISFPNKGLLRVVAEREDPATITVYKDNGVTQNVGKVTFLDNKTLSFSGPQQVHNFADLGTDFQKGFYTTGGPNFGNNLSTKKVKVKFTGCKLSKATISSQILRFYNQYDGTLVENTSGSVWSKVPEKMKKRMDPCIDPSENYNDSANGWLFSSNGYVQAYNFKPKCYGITKLNQFVMAADNFSDAAIIADNATIEYESNWYDIGSVQYNASSGTKYRSYTGTSTYWSSAGCPQVSTGKFQIESYYYYNLFDRKKYRSRTITQYIDTYRSWPAASRTSSGTNSSACCATVWTSRIDSYSCQKDCQKWDPVGCSREISVHQPKACTRPKPCTERVPCQRPKYCDGTRTQKAYTTDPNDPELLKLQKNCKSTGQGGDNYEFECPTTEECGTESYGDCTPQSCGEEEYDCGPTYSDTETYGCPVDSKCDDTCYETVYDATGNNTSSNCTGVSWEHYLAAPSGWTLSGSDREVTCDGYTPTTKYRGKYTISQSQYSNDCSFNEKNVNDGYCSCTWPTISDLSVANYGYASCYKSDNSKCSTNGIMNRYIDGWTTSTSTQKRFYSFYKRNPDGSTNSPTFEICDSSGHTNCSPTTYNGTPKGIQDNKLTQRTPYRYSLYNFFFVSGDQKTNTYSYSDKVLTSTIKSESDTNLLQNKGVYLLPTDEANTYWVCFCGDADLQLYFDDATDSSVTFSSIKEEVVYKLSLGEEDKQTVGLDKNVIDTREVFYVHPEQMKNDLDEDGNYYVDISTTGKTRIVSIELTNRPLTADDPSKLDSEIEIVGKDSDGGKVVGDSETNVEFKLNREASFSFIATPANFWIDGKSDFRQTSGTARICSNFDKFTTTVKATVPSSGSGKITLKAEQPNVVYRRSETGVWVNEFTSYHIYKITSDRKLKSINVPSFVVPRVSFSGDVQPKSYGFCSSEVSDTPDQKLFDWRASSMSHLSATNTSSPFYDRSFSSPERKLYFTLTACKLKSAKANNLNMQFSPWENDFPRISIRNLAWDYIYVDYRWGFYVDRVGDYGWRRRGSGVELDLSEAYNTYGRGTVGLTAYRDRYPATLDLWAGDSWRSFRNPIPGTASVTGMYDPRRAYTVRMTEYIEDSSYPGINYLSSVYYQVSSYDLMSRLKYYSSNTSIHNYIGTMPFNGVGDIQVYVQPQKIKASNYTRDMSDSELKSDVFGNYEYTFSEANWLLNLNNESLTKTNNSFVPLYTGGKIGNQDIAQGTYVNYKVQPTNFSIGGYYVDVDVTNVNLSLSSSKIFSAGGETLVVQEGARTNKRIIISPDDYTFEYKSDGYYHVKVPCRNVYVSSPHMVDIVTLYYAHPNIIQENLKNTRILDGYDQAINQNMKIYGNMNYNNKSSLPTVSAIQKLFYNKKANDNAVYLYPRLSGKKSALSGEEGDFFIQIWDHNNEVPAVRWKIGSSIQESTSDILVEGTGFGAFRSNYAFNGLHRMFFPYNTYSKTYAGYSYAKKSALVFAGYTLPINLILTNNGYQQTYPLSSGQVSSYTKPNAALESLAKDACSKLKTDLTNSDIYLVKYRVGSKVKLSLESCVSKGHIYTANNEANLTNALISIAKEIKQNSQDNVLRVNVDDLK